MFGLHETIHTYREVEKKGGKGHVEEERVKFIQRSSAKPQKKPSCRNWRSWTRSARGEVDSSRPGRSVRFILFSIIPSFRCFFFFHTNAAADAGYFRVPFVPDTLEYGPLGVGGVGMRGAGGLVAKTNVLFLRVAVVVGRIPQVAP